MELTKKQILELNKSQDFYLNEEIINITENVENALLIAGFVPVIGEIADIISIIRYLRRGERLKAALMLVALIPTVGDIIVKPILWAFKGSPKLLTTGGPKLGEYIAKNPQLANKFKSLEQYVSDPRVTQTVSNISKVNKGWGKGLQGGLDSLKNLSTKYTGQVGGGLKAGAKSLATGKSFAGGLKGYFQGQRLTKYFAKHGKLPSNALSSWWQNVLARRDRRMAFEKFLIANNLLDTFGIPNIKSLDNWMKNENNLNKLANDPTTSDFIAQNSSPQDFDIGQQASTDGGGSMLGAIGGAMSLNMLKYLARFIT